MLQSIVTALSLLVSLSQTPMYPPDLTAPPPAPEISYIQEDSFRIPIIMYHSVLENPPLDNVYVITPDELESDLIYLEENGYTTIVMEDLINYVLYDGDIPVNPIMLTFDDGYDNNYTLVLPLLEEYQAKAVICPISYYADNPITDYRTPMMSHQQLQALDASPWVELQSHTYNLHFSQGRKGCLRLSGETAQEYAQVFQEDLTTNSLFFALNGLTPPTTFSYPGGLTNTETHTMVVENGFIASFLTIPEHRNTITRGDADSLHLLNRFNREQGADSKAFFTYASTH